MKIKLVAIIVLICFLTITIGGALLYSRPAEAQFFPLPLPTIDIPLIAKETAKEVKDTLKAALKAVADIAYKNSLRYFLQRIAYDTATYIATGGKGGEPLLITEHWGDYFKKVGEEAVGVFFEEMSRPRTLEKGHCQNDHTKSCFKDTDCPGLPVFQSDGTTKMQYAKCVKTEWGGLGVNLCKPLSGQIQVALNVAARKSMEPRRPSCTWNTVKENLGDVRNMSVNDLVSFRNYFDPSASELGAYLTLRTQSQTYQIAEKEKEYLARQIEGGYQSVRTIITGQTKTPASTVQKAHEASIEKATEAQTTYTGNPFADALDVFTNTLVSKLLQRIFTKGFNPQVEGPASGVSDFWVAGGIAAAQLFFGELAEPSYSFATGVQVTNELSMSVGDEDAEAQFNNVIDDQFAKAIDEKCTLGQATDYYGSESEAYRPDCANLISGKASFGYNTNGQEASLHNRGLPYRSILVLRKFRIVPVGWELAAEYYKQFGLSRAEQDFGQGYRLTLNFLMDQYNQQYIDEDPSRPNPYYGLVDPDWLLKAPITRCVRQGSGPQKVEQDPYCLGQEVDGVCDGEIVYPFYRKTYCADYQSCLDDTSGQCDVNDWGYCVEEEPIWSIDGTQCDEKYYATCQTLTNQETNQTDSFLLNTLSGYSDGICDSGNAGCREYCTDIAEPFEETDWTCTPTDGGLNALGQSNRKYLTSVSQACGQEGCHLFYTSQTKDEQELLDAMAASATDPNAYGLLEEHYVNLAPDYYNCQGYTVPVSPQPSIAGVTDENACEWSNGDPLTGTPTGYFWRDDLNVCVTSGYEQCASFVKHCTVDDANCKLYTPLSTNDPAVPAVITSKDCSAAATGDCSDETDPAIVWWDECPASCVGYQNYHQMQTPFEAAEDDDFIASSASTCSQPGCDQFTNLDEVARGGEGIEYYSYLRQCIKPEEGGWLTYYTWEGSDTTGYQLKRWELQSSGGAPNGTICSDLTDADCRQFFDQSLNSYMVYYSTTVVVSDDCHPFRRSIAETDGGAWCTAHSGQMSGGYCIYQAIPSESVNCSSSNNMCREYKSNSGYNYQKIIESYFSTPNDLDGWTGGTISNESVRRGDYSLIVLGGDMIDHDLSAGDLEEGRLYTLEFLAKGANLLTATFSGNTNVSTSLTLTNANDWLHYSLKIPDLRPTGLTLAEAENDTLIIAVEGTTYLDNIILKKMDSLNLIKDSWTTPVECDIPVLGEHLGCESYQDSDDNYINLRSFTDLCFEEVVGCEPVIDSQNTLAMSDDAAASPIYLVIDNAPTCDADSKGCTRLGLIVPDRQLDEVTGDLVYYFEDKYKIVDPDRDFEQECLDYQVYCQAYLDSNGNPYYFKDPLYRICEYKRLPGEAQSAWYQIGSDELCTDADDYPPLDTIYTRHCIGGVSLLADGSCTLDSHCTNLAAPSSSGVCSDWVAECAENASGCREFKDPQEPLGCEKECKNFEHLYPAPPANPLCDKEDLICNHYYYKDVEQTCSTVNPSQGCVAFCQTDGECDIIRSYKVCEYDIDLTCEHDSDCTSVGGRCVYTNAGVSLQYTR